jgi:hypothetical protein
MGREIVSDDVDLASERLGGDGFGQKVDELDVGNLNKPVRGKLLYELDDVPTRDMKLFAKMLK